MPGQRSSPIRAPLRLEHRETSPSVSPDRSCSRAPRAGRGGNLAAAADGGPRQGNVGSFRLAKPAWQRMIRVALLQTPKSVEASYRPSASSAVRSALVTSGLHDGETEARPPGRSLSRPVTGSPSWRTRPRAEGPRTPGDDGEPSRTRFDPLGQRRRVIQESPRAPTILID